MLRSMAVQPWTKGTVSWDYSVRLSTCRGSRAALQLWCRSTEAGQSATVRPARGCRPPALGRQERGLHALEMALIAPGGRSRRSAWRGAPRRRTRRERPDMFGVYIIKQYERGVQFRLGRVRDGV